MKKIKIAINGFGRLGRSIARIIAMQEDMELVAINDISSWEILSYLLEHDSTHHHFPKPIKFSDQELFINHKKVKTFNHSNPKDIDFSDADIVIESSGKFLEQKDFLHHLEKGVKKVILSAPSNDDMPTFVLGVNHQNYNDENIISNASCTTNCLAPICYILDKHFGIDNGNIITIHSYTNDQNLLDHAHKNDKRRSRAAANNIIPTSTGAAKNLYKVLPNLKNKLHGHSVRIPVSNVSLLDLNINLLKTPSLETLNSLFEEYATTSLKGILSIDSHFGVSSDFLQNTHSSIIAKDLSFNINNLVKIMAWYDNEWGYSNRIVELARYILNK
ncbi:type I glyceraldehyde-3-phosphate dehydrogenase [Helicobacter sp. faydin-H20]|uniref:type I glyceraldehyde-3-phosphate dehydrogenase n=1 Tax=Helicobacter anatolicus TaxID=2905874 RepID=UPI001E4C9917|nr:type I glyceraldehyde-3-phosphate dehydrogenase [Helicobacter anatolicus]MCE3037110.1 type I glyceraldehyde-3-phosphate dehydrogenase [Helicobacter anatolicus]